MKLLLCAYCSDVRALHTDDEIKCQCGRSQGRYTDDKRTGEISGADAYAIGFNNYTLIAALKAHVDEGDLPNGGRTFEAFVIPEGSPTLKRV